MTDTHWANPQFSVTLSDRDEDGDNVCSLVIQLMQKDGRKLKQFGKKNQHIGFFVYQVQLINYCTLEHIICLSFFEHNVYLNITPIRLTRVKKIRWSQVRDWRFVGLDLTFSNPVKTDGPVETVQLRT